MSLRIGKLAEAAGVGVETIRFYERRGLLAQPERQRPGYRAYAQDDVARIRFIKSAQQLGFTLKEIAELLQLEQDSRARCGDVQQRAADKVRAVDEKIAALLRMRSELERLSGCCPSDQPLADCQLIGCLAGTCAA
jgi:MerR family mercuric resistance operon transcriptional regulator